MVQGDGLIKSPSDRKYLCVLTAILNNMDQIGRALPSIRFASLARDRGILLEFDVNQCDSGPFTVSRNTMTEWRITD